MWSGAALAAGAVGYLVLSHALMLHAAGEPWAVAVLLGPLVVATGAMAWRTRRPALLAATLAVAAGLALVTARGGVGTVDALCMLQHAGMHLALGISFALTLRQPRSMIGRVAERVHPLTPAMVRYTRQVTQVWTAYFFGMAALSVGVFAAASWQTWSLLANVATPAALVALFVGEYALRYRLHPEFERVSLADTVGAWRRGGPHARWRALPPEGALPDWPGNAGSSASGVER